MSNRFVKIWLLTISLTFTNTLFAFSFPNNKKYIKDNYSFFKSKFEFYVSSRPKEERFYLFSIAGKVLFYNKLLTESAGYLEKALKERVSEDISQHVTMLIFINKKNNNKRKLKKYLKMANKDFKGNRYIASVVKLNSGLGIQSLQKEMDKIPQGLRNEVYWANYRFLVEQGQVKEAIKFVRTHKLIHRGDYNSVFERDLINIALNRKTKPDCAKKLEKYRSSYSYGVIGCSILQEWRQGKSQKKGFADLEKYFEHFDVNKKYVIKMLKEIVSN